MRNKKMWVDLGGARTEITPGHPKLPGNTLPFSPLAQRTHRCITFRWESEVQIQAPARINLHAQMGSCASTMRLYPEVLQYVTYMHSPSPDAGIQVPTEYFFWQEVHVILGSLRLKTWNQILLLFFLLCSVCLSTGCQKCRLHLYNRCLQHQSEAGFICIFLLFVFTNCWLPHSEVSEKEKFS